MSFFRRAALMLPSAFLSGVLLFLLTHGHADPGFGTYPFFEQWAGGALLARTPEARFVEQSLLFFVPIYVLALLFVLFVAVAENGVFGRRPQAEPSAYRRAFARVFLVAFLALNLALVVAGERAVSALAPGALVAPLLVAAAPFAAAAAALIPSAVLAFPFAAFLRASAA